MSPNSRDIDALDEAFLNRYSDSIYICNFFETLRESWLNFPLFMVRGYTQVVMVDEN
jgi:hypothetical protein